MSDLVIFCYKQYEFVQEFITDYVVFIFNTIKTSKPQVFVYNKIINIKDYALSFYYNKNTNYDNSNIELKDFPPKE